MTERPGFYNTWYYRNAPTESSGYIYCYYSRDKVMISPNYYDYQLGNYVIIDVPDISEKTWHDWLRE